MIQRIQSVYLFLAGIIPAITFFAPVARLQAGDGLLSMSSLGYEAANFPVDEGVMPWGMTVTALLLVAINLWAIFCYRNRKKQVTLTNWAVAITLLFYIAAVVHIVMIANDASVSVSPAPMLFAPLAALCFTMLARRAIKRDEALVRAADRIR